MLKTTFLAAAVGLALSGCGDQTRVVDWMHGADPQNQSSLPATPTAIALSNPSKSPSRDTTPTLKISGVKSGLDVYVYKTSACSTAIKSGRATSSTISLTLSALPNGSYKFYTKAKNKFGYSKCKGSVAYTVDTIAPSRPNVSLPAASSFVDAAETISGSCESGAAVKITGNITTASATCSGGSFNIPVNFTSGDGVKNISVSQTDAAGNISAAHAVSYERDSTDPIVEIDAPALINNANQNTYSISGTCSENDNTITITAPSALNGTSTTCASNIFSFSNLDVHSIADGDINFTVQATDASSNSSTDTKTASKDATAPAISMLSLSNPATTPGNDTTPDIEVSGTFPIGDTFQLFSDATCTSSISNSIAATGANSIVITSSTISTNATYTYFAKGTDAAGNTSCSGAGVFISYTLDTVLPTLTFTVGANINNSNKNAYSIGGACTGENGRTISVTAPAALNSLTATCASNAWTITSINATGVSDGAVTMTVSLTDAAGNNRTTNRNITKDTVNPTVTITSLPAINSGNHYSYSFSGTCTANGDTVGVTAPVSGYTTTCASGTFTLSGLNVSGVADGTVNFTVQNRDAVLNTGTHSASTTKSVGDVTPPSDPTCDSLGSDATPTKSDTVTWSGSTDVSGIDHYEMKIYRPRTDTTIIEWTDIGADVNPYRFTGLVDKLLFDDARNEEHPVVYQTFIRAMDPHGNYSNAVQCPDWHLKPAYGNFTGEVTNNEATPENFNATDAFKLMFSHDKFNPSYFDHETVKNPQNITIKEAGNYLLAYNIPMKRKNENSTSQIASAKTIVRVNGNEIPHAIAANSLSWGRQNDFDNPIYTSNHLTILLEGLQEEDVVTIETQNNADENELLTKVESQPFTAFLQLIPDEQYKFSATASELDTGSNLNDGEGKVVWYPSIHDESGYEYDAGQPYNVTFKDDGDYFIAMNIPFENTDGSPGNQKIEARIYIDGEDQKQSNLMVASNGMITNLNNHKLASANYSTVVQGITRGQNLQVVVRRMGESGQLNVPHHQPMSLIIYRLPKTSTNYLMVSGNNGDWNDDVTVEWIKDYLYDSEVYGYEASSALTLKSVGDYLVTANIQLDIDTDFSKPYLYLSKNGDMIPGSMCAAANMTITPTEANIANCVIQIMLQDVEENDVLMLSSKLDVADGKSGAPSSPKITIRRLTEPAAK